MFVIYRDMKHIKLYEAFNNYDLPNFRVKLLNPGMTNGKYLFTCLDDSSNSFFGVFDISGLKKLEDVMNTECVFAELENAIEYKDKQSDNRAFGNAEIVVSKVPSDTKYINLLYRDFDFSGGLIKNKPSRMTVGSSGRLGSEHVIQGYSVFPSSAHIENDPEKEPIHEYPAKLNVLYYEDHHFSTGGETKNYSEAFDDLVGFGKSFYGEWREFAIDDIQPFITSIIDAGAPDGFIKAIEKIKSLPKIKHDEPAEKDGNETEFENLFYPYWDQINDINYTYSFPGFEIRGVGGSKERSESLEDIRKEKVKRIKPILKKIESLFKSYESKLSPEYIKRKREELLFVVDEASS
jgi:hypothetical protein